MKKLAPILLFTYNRLQHTRATIENLSRNILADESILYVFSDAARDQVNNQKVDEVRKSLRTIRGFKEVHIIERSTNYGLGKNIIQGVTEMVDKHGKVIILEDDLLTSPFFLKYMNEALDKYENAKEVISIHGYVFPSQKPLPETFFLKGADCWGWATWKNKWDLFESNGSLLLEKLEQTGLANSFDLDGSYPFTQMLRDQISGKNDSWAVRWYASAFLNNKLTLYPGRSLVFHSGGDRSGTNTGYDNLMNVELSSSPIELTDQEIIHNDAAWKAFSNFMRKVSNPGLFYRIKRKIKGIVNR